MSYYHCLSHLPSHPSPEQVLRALRDLTECDSTGCHEPMQLAHPPAATSTAWCLFASFGLLVLALMMKRADPRK